MIMQVRSFAQLTIQRFAGPLLIGLAMLAARPTSAVDYLRDVKPLLTEQCYKCHGAAQQKADLRLDTVAFALKGGENGPALQPGQSSRSLLLQTVQGTHDSIARMPYKKSPLTEPQIALLAQWINEGAKAPADEAPETAKHWAFVSPARPPVPQGVETVISKSVVGGRSADSLIPDSLITNSPRNRNPIDAFILARLTREKLSPAPEASRPTLLRRLNLDLIGLPPTPEEVAAYVNDKSADAYERAVDRLLASPHYGERWGRWWLDAARYADSNGYSIDAPRQIWKYRDWVVAALNKDMPFDQFALEQLAGDLLPDATLEQKIATGFNRNTQINQEGGIDPEQFRVESVMDRVNTFGTVFLGLTVGCAQCHDHKFDPILQREYYQLYAFFNSTIQDGHGSGTPGGVMEIPDETDSAENVKKDLEETREDLNRYLNAKGSAVVKWEESLADEGRAKLPANVRTAMKPAWSERTLEQKRAVYATFKQDDPEFKARNAKLAALEKGTPKRVTTLVMQELKQPRETHLFTKGDFTRPSDKVQPGVPAVLHPLSMEHRPPARFLDPNTPPAGSETGVPNRLDLARWVIDPANPLTARVLVNRIWQQYFGRGLVETENDFGTQGALPTHPELLDWLACEFSKAPWSLKHLHRLIVTSATYRQSSRLRPELATIDPLNKLLARQSRLRLDSEVIRDSALFASGLLSPKIGGPPVYPPQPDGVMNLGQSRRDWKASTGDDRNRRGLYTHFWRATPHPALAVFDAPDGFSACTRRLRSNTPLQALTLLNDLQFYEFAEGLATRVLQSPAKNDAERIDQAFRLCLSRAPSQPEQQRLQQLLAQQFAQEQGDESTRRKEACKTIARVLLNLDETITRE